MTNNASPFAPVFLLLVAVSLVITYLLVRRGQVPLLAALSVGSAVDAVLFGLFALAQGDSASVALAVGIVIGVMFNVLWVLIAYYISRNGRAVKPAQPDAKTE